MGLYMTQEAGFEVPAGWLDASVNVLEYTRSGGAIRVGILRTPRDGKELEACVEARLTDQRRKLPHFEVCARSARLVAGLSAVDVGAKHVEGSLTMYHRSLSFVLGKQLLVLLTSGPEAHREEIDAIFERAASSVALRPPSSAS